MCDVAERIENKGIIIGKAEGESVSCSRFCRVKRSGMRWSAWGRSGE